MASKGREAALGLYRSILRAHNRHLPAEMRSLGDAYVKSEFKMHKKVTDSAQLNQFFAAWEQYLDQLLQTARRKETVSAGSLDEKGTSPTKFGQHLSSEIDLSDEQKDQLEKLREEASKAR